MAIGDLPLTQQPPIYRESLGRGRPTGEELQMVSTFSIWIFRLEFWTTFQDVPFIPEIFWSVEPKLPYIYILTKNSGIYGLYGKQPLCYHSN